MRSPNVTVPTVICYPYKFLKIVLDEARGNETLSPGSVFWLSVNRNYLYISQFSQTTVY